MHASQLSEVYWENKESLMKNNLHLIDIRKGLLKRRAELYENAINLKGVTSDRCVGFIDCTKNKSSRPGGPNRNQRSLYSGHKKFHCLTYQTLSTLDGLIVALWGPKVGRRHDLMLMRRSAWEGFLEEILNINDDQYYDYCDSAYILRPYMMVPFVM